MIASSSIGSIGRCDEKLDSTTIPSGPSTLELPLLTPPNVPQRRPKTAMQIERERATVERQKAEKKAKAKIENALNHQLQALKNSVAHEEKLAAARQYSSLGFDVPPSVGVVAAPDYDEGTMASGGGLMSILSAPSTNMASKGSSRNATLKEAEQLVDIPSPGAECFICKVMGSVGTGGGGDL